LIGTQRNLVHDTFVAVDAGLASALHLLVFFCAERSWALRSQAAALWQARHSRESLAFM